MRPARHSPDPEPDTVVPTVPTPEQLELFVQPVVRLADRRVTGWEALARGTAGTGAMSAPTDFIPQAERSGAIHEIGRWVLDGALAWLARGQHPCTIAVNVSAVQFDHPGFVDEVTRALARHGMPGDRLVLELTESVALADPVSARSVVSSLQASGVRVAIDDVGVGFADADLVRALPAAILKLDRSLVARIPDREALDTIQAWLRLAREQGMEVIAEGVGSDAQASTLAAFGCRWGQGAHFGEAIPAESSTPCGEHATEPSGVAPPRARHPR